MGQIPKSPIPKSLGFFKEKPFQREYFAAWDRREVTAGLFHDPTQELIPELEGESEWGELQGSSRPPWKSGNGHSGAVWKTLTKSSWKRQFSLLNSGIKIRSGLCSRSRDLAADETLGSKISFSLFARTDGNCESSQCSQYLAVFPWNSRGVGWLFCVCGDSSRVTAPSPFPPSWQGGFARI